MSSDRPLIVQSDFQVLLEVEHPRFEEARDRLLVFAQLEKAPEHVHTWRIAPLTIWNACSAGATADSLITSLKELSRYEVPEVVEREMREWAERFGRVELVRVDGELRLRTDTPFLAEQLLRRDSVARLLGVRRSEREFELPLAVRGRIKQTLVKSGFPAHDLAGYAAGTPLAVELRSERFSLRDYQAEAATRFHSGGTERGGSGVIVLPCGAGKTVVGLAALARIGASTLILTTSTTAVRQWIAEILDKTTLSADQVGEYTGDRKALRPVTVTTYQVLTWRPSKIDAFPHLAVFDEQNWGLIVYDEVHTLPAPVFQATAGLQARRRLGLTATLLREDGREDDVFALIGPKVHDVPWRVLESQGWIAKARCTEIRLPLPIEDAVRYDASEERDRFRIAAENPAKTELVARILARHPDESGLIIGVYVDQMTRLARELGIPLISGGTAQRKRDELYAALRSGRLRTLAVTKIANYAVDLPDASLAIQVSGTFGSRQEEAQRLGRILRPKRGSNQAHFYTLVSKDTTEQQFALARQRFLCEQGYAYRIADYADADDAIGPNPV
ncbi:MAG: helicase-associated domain-containing protein [Planctomycetes bacterium]|nr:helicase-associated domain-containing protein [Planctomycetota bacterium]